MATISSHVLDSVIGTHASGIRVECVQRTQHGQSQSIFNSVAAADGRLSETFSVDPDKSALEFDLIFHSAEYFQAFQLPDDGFQVLKTIVVRIVLADPNETYHLPIMLSPHSYSVWWSGNPSITKS